MTEQPMYLNQFGAPPNRPRRTRLIIAAVVVAAVLLTGAIVTVVLLNADPNTSPAEAQATTAAATPTAASPTPTLPGDTIAQETCVEANDAYDRVDDLYKPEYVKQLGEKARTSNVTAVQDFGFQMVTKAELAAKNKGKDGELRTTLEMSTAATRFVTWCLENGYIKPSK